MIGQEKTTWKMPALNSVRVDLPFVNRY